MFVMDICRTSFINLLYKKDDGKSFTFDNISGPMILNYLTIQDVEYLKYLASSPKFSGKINFKYAEIDRVMKNRGFKILACGTNRRVYQHLENKYFVAKVAIDKVGMTDSPMEYKNQQYLQPFVTKVFDVSPCGTVAFCERVSPITSRYEFKSIVDLVFNMLYFCIIGKYVVDDIGVDYYMNYGIREGFGPVLLDYPYVYNLDGNKLFCNKKEMPSGEVCNGIIDYDTGFNRLVCTKCGKHYFAKNLKLADNDNNKPTIVKYKGEIGMQIKLKRGNEVIMEKDTERVTDSIQKPTKKQSVREKIVNGARRLVVDLSNSEPTKKVVKNTNEDIEVKIKQAPKTEEYDVKSTFIPTEEEKEESATEERPIEDIIADVISNTDNVDSDEVKTEIGQKLYEALGISADEDVTKSVSHQIISEVDLEVEDEEPTDKDSEEDIISKYEDVYEGDGQKYEKIVNKKKNIIDNF